MKPPAPEYVEPGHPGVWPEGESAQVRAIYDRMLAEQNAGREKATRKSGRR